MPFKNKEDYTAYMRVYREKHKPVRKPVNPDVFSQAQGGTDGAVYPVNPSVNPDREAKLKKLEAVGITLDGNKVAKEPAPEKEVLPIYNPDKHKAGTRVRVWQWGRWTPTIVPELDADGQIIPQTPISRSFHLLPSTTEHQFTSDAKPESKKRGRRYAVK